MFRIHHHGNEAPTVAATRWADADPVAGVPPAHPAASAAAAMATAAAAPRTAPGRNLMPL